MSLRHPVLLTLAVLFGAALAVLPAATEMMPLDEVRAGMRGTGVTVFQGMERSEFTAEIIGVLENSVGVRRNLILARLEGGPLAVSGVIQGMSGSPVYVDGRLIGAVSYSMGSFPKDTIAGITPIEEMLSDDTGPVTRLQPVATRLSLPLATDALTALLPDRLARPGPFASRAGDVTATGLSPADGAALGVQLRPIATPMAMSGFHADAVAHMSPLFRSAGMVPVVAGALTAQTLPDGPLQAGDAIGVSLVRGDLSMAGTGTVTLVDEGRVHAFGHPFYNLGGAAFPMTRAFIHGVLPSLSISSKISAVGDVLGTIDQDRATGISGRHGPGPHMVPVHVTLDSPDRGKRDTFDLEVVADDFFTPLLTYNAMLNTLFTHSRQIGASTYVVSGEARLVGQAAVQFEEIFSGDNATILAALYVAGPLTALINNGFETVTVDGIDLSITAHDDVRLATLDRVWIDDPRPRAGRTIPVRITTQTRRGEEIARTVMVNLPASARGQWQVLVADGTTLAQQERQESGRDLQAGDLGQLIEAMNGARRNNRLYVQLRRTDAGAVMNGRRMASLPPSVLDVLGADRSGRGFTPLRTAVMGEWSVPLDHVVSGSRVVTLDLDRP
ncbi:MAG: hypothetical protein O3A25_08460 [Acidobacteria bacterium]|nr:hypothetical protein [Acidobacteriota bacterium]